MDKNAIIISLVSGLVSGIVISILNYFLNKRKTDAEIEKLKAETEKLVKETKNLSQKVVEGFSVSSDEVLYDGDNPDNFDFLAKNSYLSKNGQRIGEKSEGSFEIKNNVLNIERENTKGRIEIKLVKYLNRKTDYIEADNTLDKKRKLHLKFETKLTGEGSHTLDFVIKDKETGGWLTSRKIEIDNLDWMEKNLYFRVSNQRDFYLRIDNRDVTESPSSVQIKGLKLIEKY